MRAGDHAEAGREAAGSRWSAGDESLRGLRRLPLFFR